MKASYSLVLLISTEFDLNDGAICKNGFVPLTTSWQDCKAAAEALGFSGDMVAHVGYRFPGWSNRRPEGCFQSDGNKRFHFNTGPGGNYIGDDKILCIKGKRFSHNKSSNY